MVRFMAPVIDKVIKLEPSGSGWTVRVLHQFTFPGVAGGPLVMGPKGRIYGTTGGIETNIAVVGTAYSLDY
jgi:hypothetical protein